MAMQKIKAGKVKTGKIRTGDMVIVLAGRDKGRTGKVLKKLDAKHLLVEGINMVKKHKKGNPNTGEQGGIVEKEAKIDASNVAILNPTTNKADRVGFKFVGTGDEKRKVRYFKSNDEVVDV